MRVEVEKVKGKWLSNGFAMFAMFFGAGNVIFPLIVGQTVGGGISYALIGLLLTAVLIPFSGLLAITLFEGNYVAFFQRMGKWPGFFMSFIAVSLIGPFGAIPRCISLTYSSLKFYLPEVPLIPFSIGACLLIFICTVKKQKIIDLLGMVLTPLLIVFLGIIVIKGLFLSPETELITSSINQGAFFYGLKEGYNTLDLIAALFFSSIICARLKTEIGERQEGGKLFFKTFFKSASLGALLLGVIYIGFAIVASLYGQALSNVAPDQLLASLGFMILGPYAGFVICMAVALSCLTTAIALSVVSAEFTQKVLTKNRMNYKHSLYIVLILTGLVSMLEFSGIVRLLAPILQICYPALIGLSILNVLYKTLNIQTVKLPVYFIIVWMALTALLTK